MSEELKNVEETTKNETEPVLEAGNEQPDQQETVKPLATEDKFLLIQELNALQLAMSSTFYKPKTIKVSGKSTKGEQKEEVVGSIQLNMYSYAQLMHMQRRSLEILEILDKQNNL